MGSDFVWKSFALLTVETPPQVGKPLEKSLARVLACGLTSLARLVVITETRALLRHLPVVQTEAGVQGETVGLLVPGPGPTTLGQAAGHHQARVGGGVGVLRGPGAGGGGGLGPVGQVLAVGPPTFCYEVAAYSKSTCTAASCGSTLK